MPYSPLPPAPPTRRRTAAAVLLSGLLLSLLGASVVPAAAQGPRAKPAAAEAAPPVPAEPGLTTATYGDWMLRCQRLGGEGAGRVCEVAQTIQAQGQSGPVAQVAIGRLPGQDGLRMTVLLPANVSFPSSVRVAEAKDAKAGLDLAWRRCMPGACVADGAATEAVLTSWRKAEEPGRITFKDADGREVAVALSLRGLGAALDALGKEKI
ncbi:MULTISPECIES: invasion associated locus B family protein [Methylobacterium]|uniref:invasion associated locus B family protein n=1 Tax=Methylobacterium TaxID=407 RepID=UPI0013EDE9DE|nr:invasion associated locus B family protein [Methylobacterium sp. DB0501]NGM37075.1 invasion protein [Methylobacterium sp. DB0501]